MRLLAIAVLVASVGACGVFAADDTTAATPPPDVDAGEAGPPAVGGPPTGTFTLLPVASPIAVVHGQQVKVPLTVKRADSNILPITVTTEGLRGGIQSLPLTIDGDSGDLTLNVPVDTPTGPASGLIDATEKGGMKVSIPLTMAIQGRPGEIDTSWGSGGSTTTPGDLRAILVAPDDSVYVVGGGGSGSMNVAHLSADGVLDTTYGKTGPSLFAFSATAAALQPDGKIVIVGGFGDTSTYACRLDAKGAADPSFGPGTLAAGLIRLTPGGLDGYTDGATAVSVRASDGHIFIGWDNLQPDRATIKNGSMHLDAQGNLVSGFGVGGTARSAVGLTTAMTVRNNPTSKSRGNLAMIWAGTGASKDSLGFTQINGDTSGVDPNVSPPIKTVTVPGANRPLGYGAMGLVELADDSIVTGVVNAGTSVYLRKYNAAGDGDPAFGVNGLAGPFAVAGTPTGIAVQADGKLIVSTAYGSLTPGSSRQDAVRFTANGTLDATFGAAHHPLGSSEGYAFKVVVQKKTGRILLGGSTTLSAYWP